jgi:hypothetical protein
MDDYELKEKFFDFMDELDPYRDTENDDYMSLDSMLYDLLEIRTEANDWKDDDPELYETLESVIKEFKAAGIEII